MHDLIIIGGGPAGLTAAVYAIRKRLNVLLISKDLGGKTNYHLSLPWIEDYQVINGLEVVSKFKSELEYLKFARLIEPVERVDPHEDGYVVYTRGGLDLPTRALIVASGTRQKRLDVPGEKEFIMRGLCYSALSYAPLFIDKKTAVIGEGDLALRAAAELALMAEQVHLIGPSGAALETPLGRKLRAAPNVHLMERYRVIAVKGNEFAEKLVVQSPEGKETALEVDGAFVELGLVSNAQMVAGLVDLDENGRIIVDCAARTSRAGIFAAGDVTNQFAEQVLIAMGEGAKAALSAYEYLLPRL